MMTQDEKPRWRVYTVKQANLHGYADDKYGVREEYEDGATRHIHNEIKDSLEEAEILAAKFNINSRKGMSYDNVMKRWN